MEEGINHASRMIDHRGREPTNALSKSHHPARSDAGVGSVFNVLSSVVVRTVRSRHRLSPLEALYRYGCLKASTAEAAERNAEDTKVRWLSFTRIPQDSGANMTLISRIALIPQKLRALATLLSPSQSRTSTLHRRRSCPVEVRLRPLRRWRELSWQRENPRSSASIGAISVRFSSNPTNREVRRSRQVTSRAPVPPFISRTPRNRATTSACPLRPSAPILPCPLRVRLSSNRPDRGRAA